MEVNKDEEEAMIKNFNQIGFNKIPEKSINELQTHQIANHVLTRAALLLMEQMGIKTIDEYNQFFGKNHQKNVQEKETRKEEDRMPVSPMSEGEFRRILKTVDRNFEPCSPTSRTTILSGLLPKITIPEAVKNLENDKFAIPATPTMARKSVPEARRLIFTSTPRRSLDLPRRTEMPKPSTQRRISTGPLIGDKTPMENRASRLRRQKLEESRKSLGPDTSLNSSFGWK